MANASASAVQLFTLSRDERGMAEEPTDSEESAQGQSVRRRASAGIRRVTRDSLATSPTSRTTRTEKVPAERMQGVPPEKGAAPFGRWSRGGPSTRTASASVGAAVRLRAVTRGRAPFVPLGWVAAEGGSVLCYHSLELAGLATSRSLQLAEVQRSVTRTAGSQKSPMQPLATAPLLLPGISLSLGRPVAAFHVLVLGASARYQ